jgi:hypothetical protein
MMTDETATAIFWGSIAVAIGVFGLKMLDIHNEHGRPVYEAAEKGDRDALAIIRDADKGDPFWRWVLDAP